MSAARLRPFRRVSYTAVALISAGALVAGCTSNEPESSGDSGTANAASDNDEEGDTVRIGYQAAQSADRPLSLLRRRLALA